jgi:LmbE family N-acetylglucosaminyl deacetylase
MRVLAIAPHPDDELIGAGGSLIRHARRGAEVTCLQVVGREPTLDGERTDAEYDAEIELARSRLGATECVSLNAPSRDLLPTRELRLRVAEVVRRVRPDIVYLPHRDEADLEHQVVHDIAHDGLWMASAGFFPEAGPRPCPPPRLVLGYEVWTPLRRFQHVEDISDAVEQKVAAMRAYASQLEHVAWDEAVRGLAAYRGAMAQGGGHAEVFEVLRMGPAAVA